MDSDDRKKLMADGYRILRVSTCKKKITELRPSGSWGLVGSYKTIAETDRALAEIRKDPKTITE